MTDTVKTYSRLLRYIKPYRLRLIVGLISGLISGVSVFGVLGLLPNLLGSLSGKEQQQDKLINVDKLFGPLMEKIKNTFPLETWFPNNGDTLTIQILLVSILALLTCFMIKALFTYLNRYFMRWVGSRIILDIRNELFGNLQNQSLAYYGKCDVGNLIARCVNDASAVEHTVANSVADLSRAPVELFAAAGYVIMKSAHEGIWFLPIAMFVIMPLAILPIVLIGRKVKGYCRRAMQRISILVGRMHENFTGIRVVKAYHMEAAEEARFQAINEKYFKTLLKGLRVELFMTPLMEFMAVLLVCVFMVYCYRSGIGLDQIMTLAAAGIFAYDPIKRLAKVNNQIQKSLSLIMIVFHNLMQQMRLLGR